MQRLSTKFCLDSSRNSIMPQDKPNMYCMIYCNDILRPSSPAEHCTTRLIHGIVGSTIRYTATTTIVVLQKDINEHPFWFLFSRECHFSSSHTIHKIEGTQPRRDSSLLTYIPPWNLLSHTQDGVRQWRP
jgi:hypothetical protein